MTGRSLSARSPSVWGSLVVVLVLAGVILLVASENEWLYGPLLDRADAAYAEKNWSRATALAKAEIKRTPDSPRARTILGRALGRDGQAQSALDVYKTIPVDVLGSDDFYVISESLIKAGKPLLAWVALDAAAKLDPKNREVSVARVALHSRYKELGINEKLADFLTTTPNGSALGQIVLGLLAVEPPNLTQNDFHPMLDRLLQRDRTTLARIANTGDARVLIARMLLEAGRPAEAQTWLTGLANTEALWLQSRAALALGEPEQANAAVEKAVGYADQHRMDYEPSRYVGAKACARCHGAIYKNQQSSDHAKTLVRIDGLADVPLPRSAVEDPHESNVVHEFERKGTTIEVRTKVGSDTYKAIVAYALGSARHGQTLVARDPSGRYKSLRISYYTGGDHWDLTSGFDPHPSAPERLLGETLATENYRACLDCHSTRFRSDLETPGPEAADHGIGCEKCHGPGENHLKAVETGFAELAVARPKGATPAERLKLCARCHSSDGSIPQTDPKFVRFQSTTFPFSRCVTESGGKLDCVACHNPHKNVETSHKYYEARCLACHSSTKPDMTLGFEPAVASICKVNATGDCIKCHMPKVEGMLPFTAFTDHHVRIHRNDATAEAK